MQRQSLDNWEPLWEGSEGKRLCVEELMTKLKNERLPRDADEENKMFITLLLLLNDPEVSTDNVLKSVVLFAEHFGDVGGRLFEHLASGGKYSEIASKAIVTLVDNMPFLPAHFATECLEAILPRLISFIPTKGRVLEVVALLRAILEKSPRTVRKMVRQLEFGEASARGDAPTGQNIRFVAEHFCTGHKLGKGMFGTVFLGYHSITGHKVAIKVFDWDTLTKRGKRPERKAEKQLRREIELMREANHPNIIQLKDVVMSKSSSWLRAKNWTELMTKLKEEGYFINLVLEYVGGGDMRDYLLKKGALLEEEAIHWLKHLAAGMKFMKDKRILHRDLKPDNLLLTSPDQNGVLKIADFGLGRFLEAGEVAETGGVGTPLYMAPEILQWQPHTEKADLWSVGVILYKMVTDRFPFPASNPRELLDRILTQSVQFPPTVQLSANFKDLITQLLQRDESCRISWPDFFGHPCVGLETSGSGSQDSGVFLPLQGVSISQLEDLQRQVERYRDDLEKKEKKLQKAEQHGLKQEKTNEMLVSQLKKTDAALARARETSATLRKELETLREGTSKKDEEHKKQIGVLHNEKEALEKTCTALQNTIRQKEEMEQRMKTKLAQWKALSNSLKEKLRKREAADGEWMSILAQHQQNQELMHQEVNQWKARLEKAELELLEAAATTDEKAKLKKHEAMLKGKKKEWLQEREDLQEELRRLRKREIESQKSFSAKINKVKHERDQFAADAAALQIEYQNLVDHVEQGMAEVASQMVEAEAKKNGKQKMEYEQLIQERERSLLSKEQELESLRAQLDEARNSYQILKKLAFNEEKTATGQQKKRRDSNEEA